MKRMIGAIAIICASAALAARADAQITITSSDVSSQFAPGNFTDTQFDSTATTINIGAPGASSWDFSGLIKSSTVTLTSIAVSGSPFTTQFPGATHVLQTTTTFSLSGLTLPVTAYVYLELSGNLLNLGEGANAIGSQASALITNTPADVFYKLPSTLGTTWTSTYLDTTVGYLAPGIPVYYGSVRHNASYIVDAYGDLKMPGGVSHHVLRIKKTDSLTTYSTSTHTLSFGKSVGFIFLSNDGTLVQVSAVSTTGPDSGTISIYPPVSWALKVNTSVTAAGAAPGKFALEQNYPNPFNPSTAISYAVPVRSNVRLAVYNVLGELVAELVNGDVEAGSHVVQWHPSTSSGVYFCRIEAVALDKSGAAFSKVQKMAYIR